MNLKGVRQARDNSNAAREAYERVVKMTFRPGDDVEVERGLGSYWVEVVAPFPESHGSMCTSGTDVWVLGDR